MDHDRSKINLLQCIVMSLGEPLPDRKNCASVAWVLGEHKPSLSIDNLSLIYWPTKHCIWTKNDSTHTHTHTRTTSDRTNTSYVGTSNIWVPNPLIPVRVPNKTQTKQETGTTIDNHNSKNEASFFWCVSSIDTQNKFVCWVTCTVSGV